MDGNINEDHARRTANQKLKDENMDKFLSRYSNLIQYLLQIQNGKLHGEAMKKITEPVNDGMDYGNAINEDN